MVDNYVKEKNDTFEEKKPNGKLNHDDKGCFQLQVSADEHEEEQGKFLSNIIDNVPNIIFVKEAKNLTFVSINSAAEEFFGHPRKEMIGKNDYDFFKKEEADGFTGKDREVLNSKKVFDIPQEKIYTKSKGERILHTKKITLLNDKGEPAYLLGISDDITEAVLAEDKIKKQNTLLTTILERSPIGYAVNNISNGKSIFVSENFEKIYGVKHGDLKSQEDFFNKVYINPVYREEMRKKIMDAIQSGDVSKMKWNNVNITTAIGEQKVISASNIPIPEQDIMVSTVQDVTDSINKSNDLEKINRFMTNRELKMIELKKELAELKEKLEKTDK